jgi:hypothetical protein
MMERFLEHLVVGFLFVAFMLVVLNHVSNLECMQNGN